MNKIEIILVHTGNTFPENLNYCIEQLKKYNFKIHLIISRKLMNFIKDEEIEICVEEDLNDEYYNTYKPNLDSIFRDGFFVRTSSRFILINNYVNIKKIKNFFHIENDVLIYDDLKLLKKTLMFDDYDHSFVIDSESRCIPSVVYFKDGTSTKLLSDFLIENGHKDDMRNLFDFFMKYKSKSANLPIIPDFFRQNYKLNYSNLYEKVNSIFDAAAIGQYLGGVDPRNIPYDTTGFVNEECIFNPSNYKYKWVNSEPFMVLENGGLVKINNLHIHSKNLKKFMNI
jgi:hypothetical protein